MQAQMASKEWCPGSTCQMGTASSCGPGLEPWTKRISEDSQATRPQAGCASHVDGVSKVTAASLVGSRQMLAMQVVSKQRCRFCVGLS